MKLIHIITVCMLLGPLMGRSQDEPIKNAEQAKKIQAMEVAYITKELNLTPEEAQKFWPVFNQYRGEVRGVIGDRNTTDQLEKQQKVLDLRKKYRNDFSRILANDRANRVFTAEEQFRQMVRREFQKRQAERRQINPGKRGF